MLSAPLQDPEQSYAAEILEYLLGRPASRRSRGAIEATRDRLTDDRLLDWWLFEGKRYHGLQGSMAASWALLDRQARRLLASHSPYKRPLPAPEGEVDWLATAHQSFLSGMPEYICRTSRIGLGLEEAEALKGWRSWVASRWGRYVAELGPPPGGSAPMPWQADRGWSVDARQLRRWAFIARRSRWPLLRNVVAESLRAVFEEQAIDQLPLPEEHAVLFELLCIVRVLRAFEPAPRAIRWLDRSATRNRIEVPGVRCFYQYPINRDRVLGTVQFAPELRDAMVRQSLRVPKWVDGLFLFREPRNGFSGLLLECKSGSQGPANAVHQLKAYREALRGKMPGPLLVCGVVERRWLEEWDERQMGTPGAGQDHWVFAPVERLSEVVTRLLA